MKKRNLIVPITLALACVITLLTVVSFSAQAAPNATCSWTGPQDNAPRNWSDVAYWDCGVVPGAGDTAIVDGIFHVIDIDAPVTVQHLTLLNNNRLNGFNTLTVTGSMRWNAVIAGGDHLSPTGAAETLVIAPGAVLTITQGGNPSRLLRGRLVNYGTIEHSAGQWLKLLYAVIDNRPGGTYHATSGWIYHNAMYSDDGGSFNNAGTLVKDRDGTFTLHAALTNAGLVNVLSDTLKVEGVAHTNVVTHTGSFSVAPPGKLTISGREHNFEPSSSISSEGTVYFVSGVKTYVRGAYNVGGLTDISGSTLQLDTPGGGVALGRVNMRGGARLRGANDITVTGVLTIAGYNSLVAGTSSHTNTLNIAPGARMQVNQWGGLSSRTLNNYGAVEQASGQCFAMNNNAVFNNHPTGVYTVTSGLIMGCYPSRSPSGAFNNHGRIAKVGIGEFEIHYNIPVTNTGAIQVWGGVLNVGGQFVQTAGETFLSDSSTLRSDGGSHLIFDGGVLRGSGVIDLFSNRRLKNNGATIDPIGLLTLDEKYTQGPSGTLRIDVGGLTSGVEHDVFSVGGNVSLDGRLILTPTGGFAPASGDVFRVMTFGSRSGEFAQVERELGLAFGPEYQSDGVVISDNPTLIEFSQRPDKRTSRAEESNGFTLRAINPTTRTITATLSDVLPVGFRYLDGSLSSSLAVSEPITSVVNDVQTLAWPQPIPLAPGSMFTLHFSVSQTTTLKSYTNTATIVATPPQGDARQIVTRDSVTIYKPASVDTRVVPSQGVAYPPAGPDDAWQLAFRKGSNLNKVSVAITTTPVCALEACGPLSYVAVVHAEQVFSMTETSPGSNRFHVVIPKGSYLSHEPAFIVPVWLTPTLRANRPLRVDSQFDQCKAMGISMGYGCGAPVINAPKFTDPSGFVTDIQTGAPIEGATVTLYRIPAALPDTRISTRDCRTVDTRPGGITGTWGLLPPATPDLGLFEDPLFTPATINPTINPQKTDEVGHYGWDVIRGCWYVKVEATGYATRYSPVVGVPPEVTDLDIALYELVILNQEPHVPSNPVPADGANNVPTNQVLGWQGGDSDGDPITYTIAISASGHPLVVDTTTLTSYSPGLVTGTTYYWAITATDGISTVVGPTWSFSTVVPIEPFTGHIIKSVAPQGQVDYGDELTYTLVISTEKGTQVAIYDRLEGTSWVRFVEQAPTGITHVDGAITGTLMITPTNQVTVSFVVQVDVPGTAGMSVDVTNRACVYLFGGTLDGCVSSNEVTNSVFQPYSIYLPLVLRN